MFNRFMRKLVAWLDPKFDKYRKKAPKFTPKTLEEFVGVLRRTPKDVLSDSDRNKIAAVMSFDSKKVKDVMIAKADMVFVHDKDFLGPLMLDKLYKSGFTHFPVVDSKEHVVGIIHTEALNALEIKKTDRASKYMVKETAYLHQDDTLKFVVEEIDRTSSFYFLVLNEKEELAGFLTVDTLLRYLLG